MAAPPTEQRSAAGHAQAGAAEVVVEAGHWHVSRWSRILEAVIETLGVVSAAGATPKIGQISLLLFCHFASLRVVMTAPAAVPDGGLEIIQIGAGLLTGVGLGAAAVAARRTRQPALLPRTCRKSRPLAPRRIWCVTACRDIHRRDSPEVQ